MPEIEVPARYRGPTNGRSRIVVQGDTVRICVDAADDEYPGFRELIFDAKGELRRFVRVAVNGEVVGNGAADVRLAAEDRVQILASAAGG